MSNNSKMAQDR